VNILTPITITDAMLLAGTTVAEPAPSETAWASGGTYALGDLRIRTTTHRVYECVQAHTGRTALPEVDTAYWKSASPTLRWAPFDVYTSTAATGTTSMTFVLQPGYFNALAMYGLVGAAVAVSIKDAPGGTVIYSETVSLTEPAPGGWYEYLFVAPKTLTKVLLTDLPIRPTAELTVTVSAASGAAVGLGMLVVGDYRPMMGDADWGGAEYGATAEPVTYSYIKTNDDGTTTIKRRHKATNARVTVVLPKDQADAALAMVQEVLDVPVAWIATDVPGYAGLNVFGIGSGSLSYEGPGVARFQINVKGLI
jgi:hypothetical protein